MRGCVIDNLANFCRRFMEPNSDMGVLRRAWMNCTEFRQDAAQSSAHTDIYVLLRFEMMTAQRRVHSVE